MLFFAVSVLAGVLTVLAPCILPLLPVVIGTSVEGKRGISLRACVVIFSLSVSVVVFTLLLKATTLLIDIPQSFWQLFSGAVIALVGIMIVFPTIWVQVPLVNALSRFGNTALAAGHKKNSYLGDALVGFALGPVFSTCSPTYLFIIATVLPASLLLGMTYLLGFVFGLALALFGIAYFGHYLVSLLDSEGKKTEMVKRVFGVVLIAIGLLILTGLDKKIETVILDSGYGATINIENTLLEQFAPKNNMNTSLSSATQNIQTITLAGGCFWCIEAYFQEAGGIIDAVSGYAGGDESTADYLKVSTGNTQHREAVQVTYDENVISTEKVLDIFWSHINPTDTQGQFADKGYQYTTAVYYHDDEQKKVAEDAKERLEKSGLFDKPIATEILPLTTFFKAEEYHQDYYKKAPEHYESYKKGSGRADFVEETWAKDAAIKFLQEEKTETMNNDTQSKGDYQYTDEEIAEKLKNLDPLAYHVVAENGTESPFNNAYWDNKAEGIYVDVVTGKPLFSSTHKYDSGTGWPSFWRTINDNSVTMNDDNSLSMKRTEIRSDAGHVGHVFDDGPKEEGGRRFCTNSASLLFVPKDQMKEKGYEEYLSLFDNKAS
jgi:peptide methionine sulfoxide reductase msrA/msrB